MQPNVFWDHDTDGDDKNSSRSVCTQISEVILFAFIYSIISKGSLITSYNVFCAPKF